MAKKIKALEIGMKAPTFSLPNQNGEMVSLEDYKGHNVVVYFYPKAMTPGCTVQACSLSEEKKKLKSLDVVVIGISADPVKKLKQFEEKYDLNFELLSDEERQVIEAYECWGLKKFMGREFMGIIRKSFFIGPDGKILLIKDKVETKKHHEDVLQFFKSL